MLGSRSKSRENQSRLDLPSQGKLVQVRSRKNKNRSRLLSRHSGFTPVCDLALASFPLLRSSGRFPALPDLRNSTSKKSFLRWDVNAKRTR